MVSNEGGNTKPQRRFKRIEQHLAVDLRINTRADFSSQVGPAVRGIVTDFGPGGMQLLLGTAHQAGTYMNIDVVLDNKSYHVGGVVKHVRWVSGTPGMMYGHGVEFVDVTEKTIRGIVAYLAKCMGSQPGLRKAA